MVAYKTKDRQKILNYEINAGRHYKLLNRSFEMLQKLSSVQLARRAKKFANKLNVN